MVFTLRAARRLEKEIYSKYFDRYAYIGRANTGIQAEISVYDNSPTTQIEVYAEDKIEEVNLLKEIANIRFSIRRAIEKANEQNGINALMNEEQLISTVMEKIRPIVESKPYTEELQARTESKIEAMKESEDVAINFDMLTINTVFSEDTIQEFKEEYKALKRRKQEINDKCSVINNSAEIALSDAQVEILTRAEIL